MSKLIFFFPFIFHRWNRSEAILLIHKNRLNATNSFPSLMKFGGDGER